MARIKGLENVRKNLAREIKGVQGRTGQGMLLAGLIVERKSNERVPIHEGILRGSSYTQKTPTAKDKLQVEVGYTAGYAVFVHENMEQKLKGQPRPDGKGVYWGPQGRPKFLESAVVDTQAEVLSVITSTAKTK